MIEATGLMGLGLGLVFLKLAPTRPALRRAAYASFAITAGVVIAVLLRTYL